MIEKISVKKVREVAEEHFRKGEFYCSEAIVASIKSNFEVDMPDEMIAMASGFPVGIGKSKCTCGALQLAYELQDSFRQKHKCLCCSVQTKGMDMASGEHKAQCIRFTGEMAEKAAEIIVRELNIENIDE